MDTPQTDPAGATTELVSTGVPLKVARLLHILEGFALFLAALANYPAASAVMPFPDSWRPYLTTAGFAGIVVGKLLRWAVNFWYTGTGTLPSLPPFVSKAALWLLVALFGAFSCSCTLPHTGVTLTPIVDPATGMVNGFSTTWKNPEGVQLRADHSTATKPATTTVYYNDGQGGWIKWDKSSGVSLGTVPTVNPEVTKATVTLTVKPTK